MRTSRCWRRARAADLRGEAGCIFVEREARGAGESGAAAVICTLLGMGPLKAHARDAGALQLREACDKSLVPPSVLSHKRVLRLFLMHPNGVPFCCMPCLTRARERKSVCFNTRRRVQQISA